MKKMWKYQYCEIRWSSGENSDNWWHACLDCEGECV